LGEFDSPYGIAVDASGLVYVTESSTFRVQVFDSMGQFIGVFGERGSGPGQFEGPFGITVTPDGSIYVVDSYNDRIQKFGHDYSFLASWGSAGTADGQFSAPFGIAHGPSGDIYVTDFGNHRVQKFDSDGTHLRSWGSRGSGPGMFDHALGIAVDSESHVYVADNENMRIQKFDRSGNYITHWSSWGYEGVNGSPHDVAIGPEGNVHVLNGACQVHEFTPNGGFVLGWRECDSGPEQYEPGFGIAIDTLGNIYILQHWNPQVQKFGYPPVQVEARTWGFIKADRR
jgi:DNA-binding beta-propeller fold protein YncE